MKFFSKSVKAPPPKIPLREIYLDKFGNRWFEYSNPLTMPAKRAIAAEIATRYAEFNLTPNELRLLFGEMKKLGNQGNFVDVFALINEVMFRLDYLGEEKTLLELALCYFVLEGEDEQDFSDFDKQRKRELWDKDSDCKAFFLSEGYRRTINYSQTSGEDINAFLKAMEPNAQKLELILRTLKSESTSITSTI